MARAGSIIGHRLADHLGRIAASAQETRAIRPFLFHDPPERRSLPLGATPLLTWRMSFHCCWAKVISRPHRSRKTEV